MTELWNALDRLDHGKAWGRTDLNDGGGKRCMVGALFNSPGTEKSFPKLLERIGDYNANPDVHALASVIREQHGTEKQTDIDVIWAFNDAAHWDNCWDDVERVMEKAAISRDEILS